MRSLKPPCQHFYLHRWFPERFSVPRKFSCISNSSTFLSSIMPTFKEHQGSAYSLGGCLISFASLAVILRFVARLRTKVGLAADDWLIVASLLCFVGFESVELWGKTPIIQHHTLAEKHLYSCSYWWLRLPSERTASPIPHTGTKGKLPLNYTMTN